MKVVRQLTNLLFALTERLPLGRDHFRTLWYLDVAKISACVAVDGEQSIGIDWPLHGPRVLNILPFADLLWKLFAESGASNVSQANLLCRLRLYPARVIGLLGLVAGMEEVIVVLIYSQ